MKKKLRKEVKKRMEQSVLSIFSGMLIKEKSQEFKPKSEKLFEDVFKTERSKLSRGTEIFKGMSKLKVLDSRKIKHLQIESKQIDSKNKNKDTNLKNDEMKIDCFSKDKITGEITERPANKGDKVDNFEKIQEVVKERFEEGKTEANEEKEFEQDIVKILEKITYILGIDMEVLGNVLNPYDVNLKDLNQLKNEIVQKLSRLINNDEIQKVVSNDLKNFLEQLGLKTGLEVEHINWLQKLNQSKVLEQIKTWNQFKNEEGKNNVISLKISEEKQEQNVSIRSEIPVVNHKGSESSIDQVNLKIQEVQNSIEPDKKKEFQNDSFNPNGKGKGENWKDKIEIISGLDSLDAGKASDQFKIPDVNATQVVQNVSELKNEIKEIQTGASIYKDLGINKEEVLKQVIDKAKVMLTEDKAEMVINLKPDHLGKLVLKVVTEKGIVMAQMIAETQQVKQIIETNLNLIKDTLQSQGYIVQEFNVSVGHHTWNRDFSYQFQNKFYSSNIRVQNNSSTYLTDFDYQQGLNAINYYLWPDSTVNYVV